MKKNDATLKVVTSIVVPVIYNLSVAGYKAVQKKRQLRKDNIYVLPKKAYTNVK